MGVLPVIAIGGAAANYAKAKREYDEAVAERDAMLAALNISADYIQDREDRFDELLEQGEAETDGNSPVQSIQVSSVVRVGNLVGKLFRANVTLILSNTSDDKNYYITDLQATPRIFGEETRGYVAKTNVQFTLKPGESKEIQLGGGKTSLDGATLDRLRKAICEACGKKLITSCGKINLTGIAETDVVFNYGNGLTYAGSTPAKYRGIASVLRYCGEAFYPSEY